MEMDVLRNPSEVIQEEAKEGDASLRDASMSPLGKPQCFNQCNIGSPSNMFGQIPTTEDPPSARIKVDIIQSKITDGLNSLDARLLEDMSPE